jgi:phage terminase large subunit-like protein
MAATEAAPPPRAAAKARAAAQDAALAVSLKKFKRGKQARAAPTRALLTRGRGG